MMSDLPMSQGILVTLNQKPLHYMHLKMLVDMFVVGCIVRKHFLTDIELANFSPLSADHHIPPQEIQMKIQIKIKTQIQTECKEIQISN